MKKTLRVILLVLAVILAAAGIAATVFWDSIEIYITPKSILTQSLTDALHRIQGRFEGSPLRILYQGLDPEGKQTAEILLQTEDPFLGTVEYDMTVQTLPGKFYGEGLVSTGSNALDLSVYLDADFMAVSSDDLLLGSYYGITYDTFQEDIRKIPLLSWMLGDRLISQWDQSVRQIQSQMTKSYAIPQPPEVSEQNLKMILLALLAAPADVEKASVTIHGQPVDCHRISYALSGTTVREVLEKVFSAEEAGAADIKAGFYLSEKFLVLADVEIQYGSRQYHLQLESSSDDPAAPIALTLSYTDGAEDMAVRYYSEALEEQWDIQKEGEALSLEYIWDPDTGEMVLSKNGSAPAALNFAEAENGFCVKSEDFSYLYSVISGQSVSENQKKTGGSMVIGKGADFAVPEYKNLDQWSMEDFLILLEGLGSLIGIRFS